jgi:pilus assembly protein CpaF
VATADEAPAALYEWLNEYTQSAGMRIPQSFDLDGGVNGAVSKTLIAVAVEAATDISGIDAQAVSERAVAEVMGAGALAELLGDSSIERVYFNGPDSAWITRAGNTTRSSASFSSVHAMETCVQRLLGTQALQGFAQGYLSDGTRVHLVTSQAGGPFVTVDRPDKSGASLEDMVGQEVLSGNMAQYLSAAVQLGRVVVVASNDIDARFDFISAMMRSLDSDRRAVLLESGGRLTRPTDHSVQLSGCSDDLASQALLMRPDYLVSADLSAHNPLRLLGMMGGSVNGGIGGIDAESAIDAEERIVRQSAASGATSREALKAMFRDRVDIVVQVLAYADGTYKVAQVMDVDDEEMQETFSGFDGFASSGQMPRWYDNAVSLGHELSSDIFN